MAVAQARAIVGPELLIGLSTHARSQVDAAATRRGTGVLDYIGVGPVFATPTKPGRAPVGLELVRYARGELQVPFFAIGGIDAGNAREVAWRRRMAVSCGSSATIPRAAASGARATAGS